MISSNNTLSSSRFGSDSLFEKKKKDYNKNINHEYLLAKTQKKYISFII